MSGRLTAPWEIDKGQVTFSAYAGSGIGRYITDLGSLGGQDAYYDPATMTIDALPVFAWYFGYEREVERQLASTFTYGTVIVRTSNCNRPTRSTCRTGARSISRGRRSRASTSWGSSVFGYRINKDGQSGPSSQLQLGTNFRF